jgi:hypothetical protein
VKNTPQTCGEIKQKARTTAMYIGGGLLLLILVILLLVLVF